MINYQLKVRRFNQTCVFELFEIRSIIAKSQQSDELQVSKLQVANSQQQTINVFLTCYKIELERLPWEAWEKHQQVSGLDEPRIPVRLRQGVSKDQIRRVDTTQLAAMSISFQVS